MLNISNRLATTAAQGAWVWVILACTSSVATAQSLVWTQQFPGSSRGIAVDPDGNSATASNNSLTGSVTVRKIDPFGNFVWETLILQKGDVVVLAVAADSTGRVGVAGRVENPYTGDVNAFLRTYDAGGGQEWSATFGDALAVDEARGIAFDSSGNVYVGGQTSGSLTVAGSLGGQDGFLRKYNAAGQVLWTEQLGTTGNDAVFGMTTDSADHPVITGRTAGDLQGPLTGSQDGFVRKYDPTGLTVWTQQFGSAGNSTEGVSVAATAGDDVLVGGRVNGTQEQFVSKYSPAGGVQWTESVSPQPFELDVAVAGDADGDAHLAGMTFQGAAFGPDLAGGEAGTDDAYVQKRLGADGTLDWSVRLSSSEDGIPSSFDKSLGIATFGAGNVYVTGETTGSFGGMGSGNGFVARLVSDVAVGDIIHDVNAAPGGAFRRAGQLNALLGMLVAIEAAIAAGDIDGATSKLMTLRSKMDGCEDGLAADANDWIIDCAVQDVIRTLTDALLAET